VLWKNNDLKCEHGQHCDYSVNISYSTHQRVEPPPVVPTASAVPDPHVGRSSSGKPATKFAKLLAKYSRPNTDTSVS